MDHNNFTELVDKLVSLPYEMEWVEFKHNRADPEEIGEYVSALSNSAALKGEPFGYLVWGVADDTHEVVGTKFNPLKKKKGNQELEGWLVTLLNPRINVTFHCGSVNDRNVVVFRIQSARSVPVRFKGREYIRIGSCKKALRDHPEKERELWSKFSSTTFEKGIVADDVDDDDVLELIDYSNFFSLLKHPVPSEKNGILERLISEKVIVRKSDNKYDVTNLGAILFAKSLKKFEGFERKAPRVIVYEGDNKNRTKREQIGDKGYAVGFTGLIEFIDTLLPQNEILETAIRTDVTLYPLIAIRELVANALIHQDFTIQGTGPMIEIFSNRMEITNPGVPLISPLRFIDESPRSRNEKLGKILRRIGICEERGSGIDKVISIVEAFQLPAPYFRATESHTVAILYGPREFSEMSKVDRVRACYQHACLLCVIGKQMTNASLRKRLNIKKSNYPMASRVIKDSIDAELIKSYSASGGSRKDAKYIPFWA